MYKMCVQVMVAKVRCEEIATEKLEELRGNEAWRLLEEQSASALNPSFGAQATVLINACSSGDGYLLTPLSPSGACPFPSVR